MALDKTTALILGPDGVPANVPTLLLSPDDARLMRQYKKFLSKYGLREMLHCNTCWEGGWHDGCEAHVTDGQIVIRCRCQLRFYSGQSY